MNHQETNTLETIKNSGRAEFLQKGYEAASLRQIVKNAGVTTGAFYGYFSSKEALFNAIVEPHARAIMNIFMSAQLDFQEIPKEEQQNHVGVESKKGMDEIVEYMYQNFDDCKLLLCCAGGTAYENFVHNMVEIEVDATLQFMETLRLLGKPIHEFDRPFCHIIVSGMYMGMFEVVRHDMPYEKARKYVRQLEDFYVAGWSTIMGI